MSCRSDGGLESIDKATKTSLDREEQELWAYEGIRGDEYQQKYGRNQQCTQD
jgi:hypothetical protein